MRRLPSLVAAAAAVALGAVALAPGASAPAGAACTTLEGDVITFSPTAGVSCRGQLTDDTDIYRNETLRSGRIGGLVFETHHVYRCSELGAKHGTADLVYPQPGVALRHIRGTTWCLHLGTDRSNTLTSPGAIIRLQGTMVGIHSGRHGSVIKVMKGTAVVTSTATQAVVTIEEGHQAAVPLAGAPKPPRPLVFSATDLQGSAQLATGALPVGPAQAAEYLQSKNAPPAAVVVGDTKQAATLEAQKLAKVRLKTVTVTADELRDSPYFPLTEAKRFGAKAIVFTGSVKIVQPILQTIAKKAPPDYILLTAFTS